MVPRVVATSGMKTRLPSRPTSASPMPTDSTALSRGIATAGKRRRVMNSTTMAAKTPTSSERRVSGRDTCRPRKPPSSTCIPSGAAARAVSSSSWPTLGSPEERSVTLTWTRAVWPSSETSVVSSAGATTEVTTSTSASADATAATDAPPPPTSRVLAGSWSTTGIDSVADPGNALLSRSCATALSVPGRS